MFIIKSSYGDIWTGPQRALDKRILCIRYLYALMIFNLCVGFIVLPAWHCFQISNYRKKIICILPLTWLSSILVSKFLTLLYIHSSGYIMFSFQSVVLLYPFILLFCHVHCLWQYNLKCLKQNTSSRVQLLKEMGKLCKWSAYFSIKLVYIQAACILQSIITFSHVNTCITILQEGDIHIPL
jgi:hypothetical protein